MKNFVLTLVLTLSFIGVLNAQVKGSAIGGRFGLDVEASYQHPLSEVNRLELGLGYNVLGYYNTINPSGPTISGVCQWVYDLSSITDGLNWYWGIGASTAIVTNYSKPYFSIGALGQAGVEYNFDFPLRLSIDCRPGMYVIPGLTYPINISGFSPCIAARYRF